MPIKPAAWTTDQYRELRKLNERYLTVTPQWYTTGTSPAIGNGTLEGWYARLGDMVDFSLRIVMGSTTTFGGAGEAWRFAPPTDLALAAVGYWVGSVYALDSGLTIRVGSAFLGGGDTYFRLANDGNGNFWRLDSPHVWANNDTLYASIRYRV